MTAQYGRVCSLIVSGASGDGLDLSNLRIRFKTAQATTQVPATLWARIYNLSDGNNGSKNTVAKIESEFTNIQLSAGYEGSFGQIFKGQIKQFRKGRENAVDSYLDIFAANSDQAYNRAVVNKPLNAGWTDGQRVQACLDAMAPYGVTAGYIAGLKTSKGLRGCVLAAPAREILRDVANSNQCYWSLDNDQLNIIPLNSYLPVAVTKGAIVITAKSGLIGIPEQTQDGIRMNVLLNPNIVTSQLLTIDNASINQSTVLQGRVDANGNPLPGSEPVSGGFYTPYDQYTGFAYLASIAADGQYRTLYVEHMGDTRGQEWYSGLTCIGMKDAVPPSQVARGLS